MWRTTTITLVAAVLLALTAGAALAATITCPTADPNSSGYGPPSSEPDLSGYDCEGTTVSETINGTPGPEYMVGLAGNDTLNGNDGEDKIDALNYDYYPDADTKIEDKGKDTVSGGPANDTIAANDGFKDDIRCGPGSRDIVYSDKGKDIVRSDCERRRSYDIVRYCPMYGLPWTGENEPGDWNLTVPWEAAREKIIWCIDGTKRDDKKLDGTTGHSDLLDSIWAGKGDDKINGGLGLDSLTGWSGNDILKGGAGPDFLYGDSSANPWEVGHFFKGAGEDKIYGGPGNDYIAAVDNKKDTISCGGGEDYVQLDKRGRGDPETGKSTVTDKVAKDCEVLLKHAEHSSLYCRLFGKRKHR
jgi:Ca2+-binding RTX toxin-like protein